jgi:hypothetical protein
MPIDLILIHSGNRFPEYINDCIELADREGFKIHLITESKFHQRIDNKNVVLADLDKYIDYRYANYRLDNYNLDFREGFFYRTSSRFILIDNYIQANKIESFFHIENDIALFSDLIKTKEILEKTSYDTAIVMDNTLRCIPSIIWYRNKFSSARMANFIYSNNKMDDMQNLALYFHYNRDNVTNLPIVPFDLVDELTKINFGNMYSEINSVFDGAAIGQYLYGIDNLEDPSKNTKGFINESTVFDFSSLSISMDNKPIINLDYKKIPINNLHMHCKNLRQLI